MNESLLVFVFSRLERRSFFQIYQHTLHTDRSYTRNKFLEIIEKHAREEKLR